MVTTPTSFTGTVLGDLPAEEGQPVHSDAVEPAEWGGDVVVVDKSTVSEGITQLTLRGIDDAALPEWAPGAHIEVTLPDGTLRQYSLTGDPTRAGTWTVAVLRDANGRGGSQYIHDHVSAGDKLSVRGPRNHFPLIEASEYRFVAGGIGITPLLPMIYAVARSGASWSLDYCGREGERIDAVELVNGLGPETALYCCGPARLLVAIDDACRWQDQVAKDPSYVTESDSSGPSIGTAAFWIGVLLTEGVEFAKDMQYRTLTITNENLDEWVKLTPPDGIAQEEWNEEKVREAFAS